MKKTLKTGVSAMPFAHLLGFPAKPSAKAEDDDKKDDDSMSEDDDADDKKDDAKAGKSGKSAGDGDEDDDKEHAEDDDDDTKAADDEDDTKASAARKAERGRWTKVLGNAAAGEGRIATACQLLSTTNLSASQIIGTLQTVPAASAGRGSDLYAAMSGVKDPKIGRDAESSGSSAAPGRSAGAAAMLAARARADGKAK